MLFFKKILTRFRNDIIIFSILTVAILLDQITKMIAEKTLKFAPPIIYWGDLFRFQYTRNTGAFLGLGAEWSPELRFWIFVVVTMLILIGAFYYLFKLKDNLYFTISLSLIVGGGIGNMIDRIIYGSVIDFMNMGIGSLRTGIFNVADVFCMAGTILLLLIQFKKKGPKKMAFDVE